MATTAVDRSWNNVERIPSSPNWANPVLIAWKRAFDVFCSLLSLIILSPVFIILSVAVKFSSRGPVFYRWHVVGKSGRFFTSYKFRSMCINADELKSQLQALNEMEGPVFKITNDPRITSVGRWMRRHSLDELPQLYSVLKGQMSLVVPRPPLQSEYLQFNDRQRQKLTVKPGITCLWQVNGRNRVKSFDEWVAMDLEYIQSWSPLLDLKILIRTLRAVFVGSGI